MAKQDKISFLEFKKKFNNEEACREYLCNMRWPEGFICPNAATRSVMRLLYAG